MDVFEVEGGFLRAFGWNVSPDGAPGDTPGDQMEVCTSTCQAGTSGAGRGQFSFGKSIAVDNDPASAASGDVYVYDGGPFGQGNGRVQRFHSNGEFVLMFGGKVNKTKVTASAPAEDQNRCPVDPGDVCQAGASGTVPGHFSSSTTSDAGIPKIELGPSGLVHVVDNIGGGDRRIQKFNLEGRLITSCSPLTPGEFGEAIRGITIDSTGAFYIANGGGAGAVRKYDTGCNLLSTFHKSFNIQAVAVDGSDNLLVADSTEAKESIYRYDSAGNVTRAFYGDGTLKSAPNSLAPYPAASDVFAAEGGALERVIHIAFPSPGPVIHPDPASTEAEPVGSTWAELNADVNPEGKDTTYRFQYVDDAAYDSQGGFSGPSTNTTPDSGVVPPVSPEIVPPLFRLALVSDLVGCKPVQNPPQASCLEPSTEYHFRVVADNLDGGPYFGPEQIFVTGPSFESLDVWSSDVGDESAKLSSEANPIGIPLSGHFEYVTEANFQASEFTEAFKTAPVDFGSGEDAVIRTAQVDGLQPGTAYRFRIVFENFLETGESDPATFTTFETFDPEPCANDSLRLGMSASLPDCRAYEMVSPVDKGGGEISVQPGPIQNEPAGLTQSAAEVLDEGTGLTYSTSRSFGDADSAPYTSQYLVRRDQQVGWSSHGISPRREGPPFFSIVNLDTQFKRFSEDLSSAWLRTDSEPTLEPDAVEGFGNLYRRDNASEGYEAICPVKPPATDSENYVPEPQGSSADEGVIVFRANDRLTGDASEKPGIYQLYGCSKGTLRLISVLPPAEGGKASGENSSAGTALSTQGDHRKLSAHNAVSVDGKYVYWTNSGTNGSGTGKIYLRRNPMGGGVPCSSATARCTVPVSETVGGLEASKAAQFWTAAADGSRAIYSFTAGTLIGNLYEYDAEDETSTLIAESVSGVSGWSEDASRIYFVSTKVLDPDAEAGKPNLYLHEVGAGPRLIATLQGTGCVLSQTPLGRCTRTTADGGRLAFTSKDPLTGYDNHDAGSGERDAEVYLYDAEANGGEGQLRCVSCNPTGGRPKGRGLPASGSPNWVAARIPDQRDGFYASRVLSSNGRRLFFESFDRLAIEDVNEALDVYQWEEPGKGECEEESPRYSESAGGCIALISSGTGAGDSKFADASADGEDVFFTTVQSLFPTDPGLVDLYDARVGGGFPSPKEPVEPCDEPGQPPCQEPVDPPAVKPPGSTDPDGGNGVPSPDCKALARKASKLTKQAAQARKAGKQAKAGELARKAKGLRAKARRCKAQAGGGR